MTIIRRINVSQVEGGNADNADINQIRPYGEIAVYLDNNNKLTLMMFDGVRTHQKSKILTPGAFYGSNADSGDGAGLDTIKLIPDATIYTNGSEQYLIVDPTVPNHIHLRAGGVIDNSSADLFLGGELTHVKVSDNFDSVVVKTTDYTGPTTKEWVFGANGSLTFPDNTVQTTAWTGVASEGTTSTTSANVGYIGMPQNPTSTSYTLVAGDQGKHIYVTTAGQTITVPANTTTAFPVGTTIAIIAGPTANPVTIDIVSDTMYLGSVGSTGTRTLAAYGMATLVKVDATTWFINGSGLS